MPTSLARFLPLGAALVALAVYVRTMLPGVGQWDTGEFQTVPRVLGVMHATGYPLYTLLGWLASWLPVGSVAYRLNLFSGLCAAAAAGLVVLLGRRLGAGWGPATAAGLLLAFFVPTWETALRADPHTLHAAFAAGLLLAMAAWREAPAPMRLGGLALLAGLSLSNHMQTTMLLPALAIGAAWGRWRALLAPRALAAAAGGLAAGLMPYLYLPLRARQHPPLNYGRPEDWPHFKALVLGEQFRQDMGLLSLKGVETFLVKLGRFPEVFAGWWAPGVAPLAAALALAGLVVLARRDRGLAAAMAVAGLLPLYWASTWINGDAARYFIVPALALVVLAAVGLEAGLAALAGRARPLARGAAALAAIAPLALVPLHLAGVDRSGEHAGEAYVRFVFDRLPPDAAIFTVWVNSTPLWYAHHVEGGRPDVLIVAESEVLLDHGGDLHAALREALAARRPVFVLRPASDADWVATRFETRTRATEPLFHYPLVEVLREK